MKSNNLRYEQYIEKLKNYPIIAFILLFSVVFIGIGGVIGSVSTIQEFVNKNFVDNTPSDDPYVFRFNNQKITFSGGNGSSIEEAVIINGALGIDAAVEAEHYFAKTFFENFSVKTQMLIRAKGNPAELYDLFILESPYGGQRELFFNVTNYFGIPVSDGEN